MPGPPVTLVFGARNIGRAIAARRCASGHPVLAVARTDATLDRLRAVHPSVHTLRADAADHTEVARVFDHALAELGEVDLVVNAITAPPRDHTFGGGPVLEAPPERLGNWMAGFVPHAWAIQRAAASVLVARGGGTLIQVAGGSARRPIAGRGLWGAAQHAARALTLALAQELRPHGVHVALLVADGVVETERVDLEGRDLQELLHPDDVAEAVDYLAGQRPRAWSHELALTPVHETYVP